MLNHQPIEKVVKTYTGTLDVHSIFLTIQGEGPFCGEPCVFIRLAGCNLQCPLCDTEYTKGRYNSTPDEIVENVYYLRRVGLVVITGGEPFRQPIGPLLDALTDAGYYVQVETNGTLPPPTLTGDRAYYQRDVSNRPSNRRGVYIVLSPKTGFTHPDTVARACCFKYVLHHTDMSPTDGLPTKALGHVANPQLARPPKGWDLPIYLQPADTGNEDTNYINLLEVLKNVQTYDGLTLQLQIHKYLGVE
jgi:organic radical activating enzyme